MAAPISCKQKGCRVATTGVCLEGVNPVSCPNATIHSASAVTPVVSNAPSASGHTKKFKSKSKIEFVSPVALPSGEELSVE